MRVIPQLNTFASFQFPAISGREARTVINRLTGGSIVLFADTGGGRIRWRAELRGLRDNERLALETFFHGVEGRLRTFTFLDPFENLLLRSQEFSASEWVKEPPLALTGGAADPMAGTAAVVAANPSPSVLRLYQSLGIPAWFQYSLTVFARSDSNELFSLFLRGGPNVTAKTFVATPVWTRYTLAASPGGNAEILEAGMEIESGTEVTLFGAQLEAQPAASDYKLTGGKSGVYPQARLMQDDLAWTTVAAGAHNTTLTIVSR